VCVSESNRLLFNTKRLPLFEEEVEMKSVDTKVSKDNASQLLEAICDLKDLIGSPDFAAHARSVQNLFNTLHPLDRSERESLWERYQEAWTNHKAHLARMIADSEEVFRELNSKMDCLDLSPDGLIFGSEMFGRADWEGMATKLSTVKALLDEVESKIRSDSQLTGKHRYELFQKLHDNRYALRQAQEWTWSELSDRAEELYNEAYYAIETMPPREALQVFKENQKLVMALYLRRSDKEKFHSWFQELWQKLQARFDERRHEYEQRKAEWRARQEAGLERLLEAREKVEAFIEKLESNIQANRDRQASAYSSDFADRVGEWIREDEEKLEDARHSLEELKRKIEDAGERLQNR